MYLDFLESFLRDRGILEQNQEISGPKEQVFPRFADPGDGTLSTTPMMMAGDPSYVIPREKSLEEIREINRRVFPGYDRVREKIQAALKGMAWLDCIYWQRSN